MILRFLGFLFTVGVVVFIVGAAAAGYVIWKISDDLPDYAVLKDYEPPVMTRFHAADGSLIGEYARERRLYLPIQAVPDRLIHAYLSAEDKNFYNHFGIDPQGIARALVVLAQSGGRVRQGGSTITQQVAKNFLLTNERTIDRKLREALLALRIERAFTKDEILELYMNEIFLGLGAYGVAGAALEYFDKSVHELTIEEAAYLAALPRAPNNYHPFRQTERAIARRNWVIDRMLDNGYITVEEAEHAKSQPLRVTPRARGSQLIASDYFAEEVRRSMVEEFGEDGLYGGGLSVRTTLDPEMQVMARRALVDGLVEYDRRQGWRGPIATVDIAGDWGPAVGEIDDLDDVEPWRMAVVLSVEDGAAEIGFKPDRLASGQFGTARDTGTIPLDGLSWARWAEGEQRGREIRSATQVLTPGDVVYVSPLEQTEDGAWSYQLQQVPEIGGAIVAMDPFTGRVLALVGGFSFDASQFNRATQAMRQPGSSFKPFVYAAALDNGYSPSSVVMDAPLEIQAGNEIWRPSNYSNEFYGPSTLRTGIERSRNVMTVRLAQDVGMPLIVQYSKLFGIYDELLPYLPMSLGAGETTVLRLTTAYAILANGGRKIEPTLIDRIQDRYGNTIYRHDARICEDCNETGWTGQDEPEIIDERDYVLDPFTAYQMTSMLEGVVLRGTARTIAELGIPLAGKTGTTNEERDAWFVGYSPDLVVGVFVGFDDPEPMGRGMTGGRLAAPIFKAFMKEAIGEEAPIPFRVPPGIHLVRVDPRTGLRSNGGGAILEAFKPGQDPPTTYSVIGFQDQFGQPLTVSPEADRAVVSGTGGLY